MAMSKSILKSQDIILCQLCEVNQTLKWKCLECLLLMCSNCKEKIHPKFKNAKDHRVVDIKDLGRFANQSTEPDFSDIKCRQHETQTCCIYCSSCELLMCPVCIAQGHKGHDFIEIKDSYLKKTEQLKKRMKNIEIEKRELEKQTKNIAKETANEYDKVLQAVQDHEETWKKAGKMYARNVSALVNKKRDEINRTMSKVLDERKHHLLQKEEKMIEMLDSQDGSFFFDSIDYLLESLEENMHVFPNLMVKFTPANIAQDFFGTLDDSREVQVKSLSLVLGRMFITELNRCHHLAMTENGTVFLCDSYKKTVMICKLIGGIISILNKISIVTADIQSFSDNSILIADATSTIKILQCDNGSIKDSKYHASPFNIFAVHVTKEKKVIIGGTYKFSLIPDSRQIVMRFDEQGKLEKTWEYDKNVKNIFTGPRYFATTDNGNIFVVDWLSDRKDGKVVVLKGDEGAFDTYTGHPYLHGNGTLFKPLDIKRTPLDNILLCDYSTNTLHLLNSSGDFLTYFDTQTIGITDLCSMTFTTNGTLLIGTAPKNDDPDISDTVKAKLYELKFMEIF